MLANLEAGKQLKTWHSEERNPKPIYSVESQKGTEMRTGQKTLQVLGRDVAGGKSWNSLKGVRVFGQFLHVANILL